MLSKHLYCPMCQQTVQWDNYGTQNNLVNYKLLTKIKSVYMNISVCIETPLSQKLGSLCTFSILSNYWFTMWLLIMIFHIIKNSKMSKRLSIKTISTLLYNGCLHKNAGD